MTKRFTAFALALVMACGVLPMGAAASGSELFAQMSGLTFNFASGAGGWWTEFTMNGDGSFKGNYHDSEIGSTGRGYPKGTVYVCKFSGRFTGGKTYQRPGILHGAGISGIRRVGKELDRRRYPVYSRHAPRAGQREGASRLSPGFKDLRAARAICGLGQYAQRMEPPAR